MSERCPCGARIMYCDLIDMQNGLEMYQYKCGVCGSEVEVKFVCDPQKY